MDQVGAGRRRTACGAEHGPTAAAAGRQRDEPRACALSPPPAQPCACARLLILHALRVEQVFDARDVALGLAGAGAGAGKQDDGGHQRRMLRAVPQELLHRVRLAACGAAAAAAAVGGGVQSGGSGRRALSGCWL